jgi:perosamine synthetase
MSLFSPQPRFRMYSSPGTYLSIFRDIAFGRAKKGDDCRKLEEEIKTRFKVAYSVSMPQARVGIYLVLRAIIKPGQKVVLSPYTVADVINMVICAGGVPVFADLERKTCNIDPGEVEKLIDQDTGAVMVTHLHGLICPIEEIADICKQRNVPLVEDAAQAFGARLNGKMTGTFGDAGVYSTGRYKNINAFYGGMVVTPHLDIHKKVRTEFDTWRFMEIGQYGKRVINALVKDIASCPPLFQLLVYQIFRFGHLHDIRFINRLIETELDLARKDELPENYSRKMMPMQARLVLSKLDRVENDNAARIRYARMYHEGLSDLPELILPPLKTDGSHIYTCYPIRYSDRRALVRWMMKGRRDVTIQHLKNCADLPAFKEYHRDCPIAGATANEVIMLPTYPRYTEREVSRNIKCIRSFFRK